MKLLHSKLHNNRWSKSLDELPNAHWVLVFGSRSLAGDNDIQQELKSAFPKAEIIGCTTSGEISGSEVFDETLVVTAIEFANTQISAASVNIQSYDSSAAAGAALANEISHKNLKHAFVISDGQLVNGTQLVDGLKTALPNDVMLTGGLAGDADRFQETKVWHNQSIESGKIVICGLYGDAIRIGHGSLGGWDPFGPARMITQSKDNVLHELDGKNALDLYKSYLGDHAADLPASALLFPLSISKTEASQPVVRTILSIDEEHKTMTFAGDIPEGHYARLMRANFDRLIDGANDAADQAHKKLAAEPELAILISCIGRRLVLGQRVEEELESVADIFGEQCVRCGFYSYGEISPVVSSLDCRLHNQTMTITTLSEDVYA